MWMPIAAGGLLGTLARYAVHLAWAPRTPHAFPTATLVVNLTGSLVLGVVMGYATGSGALGSRVQAGLSVGFCGAFTTMSAFALETGALLAAAQYGRALAYLSVTLVGSVGLAAVGVVIGQRAA